MEQFVTQTQFNDVSSRIFLRFDQMDEKMDRQYNQLRSQIDHLGTRLDDLTTELRDFKVEMREANAKTDARLENLEHKRTSVH